MSKNSAAKAVPAAGAVASAHRSLEEARGAVTASFSAMADAIKGSSREEMASLPTTVVLSMLKEILTEQYEHRYLVNCATIAKVIEAIPGGSQCSQQEYEAVLNRFHGNDAIPLADDDGKPTKVGLFLKTACANTPRGSSGKRAVLDKLFKVGVLGEDMVNIVLGSASVPVCAAFLEKFPKSNPSSDAVSAYLEHVEKTMLEGRYENAQVIASSVTTVIGDNKSRLVEFVARVAESHGCAEAVALAGMFPDLFEIVKDCVLRSASPEALARFYRHHAARCDKEVFRDKLAKAMQPDPKEMAEMVLSGGRFPFHPMDFFFMSQVGPMGRPYGRFR